MSPFRYQQHIRYFTVDIHCGAGWQIEKTKATKKYAYLMATGEKAQRTRNVHLGSCAKMDAEAALQKAKAMKAESLGISGH